MFGWFESPPAVTATLGVPVIGQVSCVGPEPCHFMTLLPHNRYVAKFYLSLQEGVGQNYTTYKPGTLPRSSTRFHQVEAKTIAQRSDRRGDLMELGQNGPGIQSESPDCQDMPKLRSPSGGRQTHLLYQTHSDSSGVRVWY